jgi:hypothetical protein
MTPAAIEKRLEALEAEVAKVAPPAPVPGCEWLAWATNDELTTMEHLLGPDPAVEPTEADRLRIMAIQCAATARMVAGEPRWVDIDHGYWTARP